MPSAVLLVTTSEAQGQGTPVLLAAPFTRVTLEGLLLSLKRIVTFRGYRIKQTGLTSA
jgi:hypothetical protein